MEPCMSVPRRGLLFSEPIGCLLGEQHCESEKHDNIRKGLTVSQHCGQACDIHSYFICRTTLCHRISADAETETQRLWSLLQVSRLGRGKTGQEFRSVSHLQLQGPVVSDTAQGASELGKSYSELTVNLSEKVWKVQLLLFKYMYKQDFTLCS